jgi:hypothetical protein
MKGQPVYGGGLPPFKQYVDYIGKPLYKFGRRRGLPEFGALAVANIPGSCWHIAGHVYHGRIKEAVIWFVLSEILFTGAIYGLHKGYQWSRKRKLNANSEKKSSNSLESLANELSRPL